MHARVRQQEPLSVEQEAGDVTVVGVAGPQGLLRERVRTCLFACVLVVCMRAPKQE